MAYVVVALILLTGLVALDLVLSLAIIRRLRAQATRLRDLEQMFQEGPELGPGSAVPHFETTTITGEAFSGASLHGTGGLVAFLSESCRGCREQLPALTAHLKVAHQAGETALVVVATTGEENVTDLIEQLSGLAAVVTEPNDGPVQRAFQVDAYPSFFRLDPGGMVSASAFSVRALSTTAAAAAL